MNFQSSYAVIFLAFFILFFQVIAGFMMIGNLNRTGFSAYSVSIPSPNELLQIFEIAAPVFITMTSKVYVHFIFRLYSVNYVS